MYLHVWRRHDRFGTFDNDLGFHSQYVYLISRGKFFSSILGLPAFGHNATFGYFLLAPFAWFGAGPQFLDFLLTVVVALGALPVYSLAKRRVDSQWIPMVLALVYLVHPVIIGNVWETFHPEAFAIAPLLAAVLAAEEGRWRRYVFMLALAIIWKTDVALFIAMLGLRVARRHDKKVGILTTVSATVWFTVCVTLLIPQLSGGGTVFGPLYGDLGDTPIDVAATAVTDPSDVVERIVDNRPDAYFRDLLAPYGFIPVLAPSSLALGLPHYAVNLLAEPRFTRDPIDNPHYQALPTLALTLAMLDGVGRLAKRWPRRAPVPATALAAVCAVIFCVAWSAAPFGVKRAHFWSADGDPLRHAKQSALAQVGPEDVVSATYLFVPHLTRRELVYSFPNPWRKVFYGVEDTELPDPGLVKILVIETALTGGYRDVYECVTKSGAFELRQTSTGSEVEVWIRRADRHDDLACQES